jgi:membrane-associated protease RseP (regulator of RpoE activity)
MAPWRLLWQAGPSPVDGVTVTGGPAKKSLRSVYQLLRYLHQSFSYRRLDAWMGALATVLTKSIPFALVALLGCGIYGVLARPPWTPTPEQRVGPRGFLGVKVRDLTPGDEARSGLKDLSSKETRGVIVVGVRPGAAAAEAGLIEGDVIVELDGKRVAGAAQFLSMTSNKALGTVVKLRVLRQGVEKLIQTRLGAQTP